MISIHGLQIDEVRLAEGVYDIIVQKGEEGVVAFGMIPLWVHEMLERLLREKVLSIILNQCGLPPEYMQVPDPDTEVDRIMRDEITLRVEEIVKNTVSSVCSGIYAAAGRAGAMLV